MRFDFRGKRVLVCGGSRGIGRSIALGFAQAGASVSICARTAASLEATRAELDGFGGTVHAGPCDLGNGADIAAYVAAAAAALGGIDVLVNNASALGVGDDEAAWEGSVAIDIMAIVRASRAAQPFLEKSAAARPREAAIVNISSISAYRPSLRTPAYGAAKAAAIHYTSSQAGLLARKGIRANCIAPGSIEFPGGLWEIRKTKEPALYDRIFKSIPFGRLGRPEEIADVALFLASPLAGWVTGQTIAVDGGQLLGA